MSPVVSVCPVHGSFESRAMEFTDFQKVTLFNSTESCPQCGRPSAIMEGVFDFDAEGIARVIAAPGWSRDALAIVQGELETAAKALASGGYSDARAYALLDHKLDGLCERVATQDEDIKQLLGQLSEQIRAIKGKLSRSRLAAVVLGIVAAVGAISAGADVTERATDGISWIVEQINQAQMPRE